MKTKDFIGFILLKKRANKMCCTTFAVWIIIVKIVYLTANPRYPLAAK